LMAGEIYFSRCGIGKELRRGSADSWHWDITWSVYHAQKK
jgi:hypothetical protein